MPNWCSNTLTITGGKRELTRLKKMAPGKRGDGKTEFSLNKFLPLPTELEGTTSPSQKQNRKLLKKYGFDNWYDWQNYNWGTKWDVDAVLQEVRGCLIYSFDSAWAPPESAIQQISKMFPKLTFELEFSEPGMNFAGRIQYVNGIIEDSKEWEPANTLDI